MKSLIRIGLLQGLFILACCASCSKTGSSSAAGAGGSLARFAIVGDYLYVLDPHYITPYNILDPQHPVAGAKLYTGFDLETIFPFKNKLFIGSASGMYVVSIADPAKPVLEGSITHFRACDPIVANDSMSYVTLRSGGNCGSTKNVLNVYDSRVPASPQLVKEVPMTSPYGLGLLDKALYVCEGSNGLTVFDLANPNSPAKVQTLTDQSYFDVIPYDTVLIAWTGGGVAFFDVTDPFHPVKEGTIND